MKAEGDMAYEFIIYEKRERIAYITLNRPDRRNAISPPMQIELWTRFTTSATTPTSGWRS